ncbi:hypothetical protein MNBD_GAMMA22-2316 [hydrothermal vent metagenome]|uniref:Cache domain-containing protein n=1 Tax=hydrothermal vent metagenome TaxID=652676 RepID=A0A3B1A1K6_9ZZZZ
MKFKRYIVLTLSLLPAIAIAAVDLSEQKLKVKILTARHIGLNPMIVDSVNRQNSEKNSLKKIKNIDEKWKNTKGLSALKLSLQNNEAGLYLKSIVEKNPDISEAFLTDMQGANVASYPATSDYWQGDEKKWQASFNNGEGKVYIGPLKVDESTNIAAVQISAPVIDYRNERKTIGVIVIGVTSDYLMSK